MSMQEALICYAAPCSRRPHYALHPVDVCPVSIINSKTEHYTTNVQSLRRLPREHKVAEQVLSHKALDL